MAVYVVAEIGINHNGSLETAQQLISMAKRCGADAVKFQKRTVELCYTPAELAKPRESPFGSTNGDLKRGLEFSFDQYQQIDTFCKELGIVWSASPWDVPSVHFLAQMGVPWLKIPSALLTNDELLTACVRTNIPIWLSTGMSTSEEIAQAIDILAPGYRSNLEQSAHWPAGLSVIPPNLTLLHCHSSYPSPIDELNLACIRSFKDCYPGVRIGYSSHTTSPWPCLMAAVYGAEVVEAHLTLDRTMFGSDQAASLEPHAFAKLVEEIRTFERAKGDGIKRVWPSELPAKEKLRR